MKRCGNGKRAAPLLSKQLKTKRQGQAGKSWDVNEMYIKVNGRWHDQYRAIDREGNLVDSMLSPTRDLAAAKAFFKQAIETVGHKPERVTTDGYDAYPRAVRRTMGRQVVHRTSQYLKQRYYPLRGFAAFASAARFCAAFDELRQYFRVRSTSQQPRPLPQQCRQFKQRFDALFATFQAA
jgi:putative transposase